MRAVPTGKSWSKQHFKIRTPRPLVDPFQLGKVHERKEWWRERRISPSTFLGFPDSSSVKLSGVIGYVEKMDSSSLVFVVAAAVGKKITSPEMLLKWSHRCQQLSSKMSITEIASVVENLNKLGFADKSLFNAFCGSINRQLLKLTRSECKVCLTLLPIGSHLHRQLSVRSELLAETANISSNKSENVPPSITCATFPQNESSSRTVSHILKLWNVSEQSAKLALTAALRELDGSSWFKIIFLLQMFNNVPQLVNVDLLNHIISDQEPLFCKISASEVKLLIECGGFIFQQKPKLARKISEYLLSNNVHFSTVANGLLLVEKGHLHLRDLTTRLSSKIDTMVKSSEIDPPSLLRLYVQSDSIGRSTKQAAKFMVSFCPKSSLIEMANENDIYNAAIELMADEGPDGTMTNISSCWNRL